MDQHSHSLLSHCSIILRQYWYAMSFSPCLDLPPAPRAPVSEAVRELGPPALLLPRLREERRRELEGVVALDVREPLRAS